MKTLTHFILTGGVLAGLIAAAPAYAQEHDHGATSDKLWSQADAYYDPAEMDAARASVLHHSGRQKTAMVMLNRAEVQFADGEEIGLWEGSAWYGGDINRLYVKSEGEYSFDADEFEEADVELLWSRAVSPYFDIQTGIKYDFEPDGLAHAALGFQGLAPYWFEVDGTAYLSEEGDLTADLEAEYELFLTQRLILQPRAEIKFSAQDVPERDLGSGITNAQAGLRLRYEFTREIAPYVGVEYHGAFGETGDRLEAAGGDADQAVWVVGLRSWF